MSDLNEIRDLMERIDRGYRDYRLLTEGMSRVLYHFTSISNGFEICRGDVIYLQSAYAKDADNYDNKRKFYLSCTRMYSGRFGYSRSSLRGGVRIVLDGDKLSNTLKGKPVNYWGGGVFNDKFKYYETMPKDDAARRSNRDSLERRYRMDNPDATQQEVDDYLAHNFDQERQFHVSNESEDRIFSYDSAIRDAHNVIKSVDFFFPGLDGNEKYRQIALSVVRTRLGSLVRIFDDEREFNNPGGKPVDIWKKSEEWGYPEANYNGDIRKGNVNVDLLRTVLLFIVSGNPDYEGKNFGAGVSSLLSKYGLTEYSSVIGSVKSEDQRLPFQHIAERLDSARRDLSDRPNEFTSRVVKMMSDYFRSLGADSFRDAYKIKSKMLEDAFNEKNGIKSKDYYDGIDWYKSVDFLMVSIGYSNLIVANPSKDRFSDLFANDGNIGSLRDFADGLAREVMEYHDYGSDYSHSRSKNVNSLYQYLYKLMRTGSIQQVLDVFNKIGIGNDYLETWGLKFYHKAIDFMHVTNYDTVSTYKMSYNDNADYRKIRNIKDNELIRFYKTQDKG